MRSVIDEELQELARLSASTRQLVVAVALAIVVMPLTGWLLGGVLEVPPKWVLAGVVASLLAAMAIAMQLRTPPERFPAIRILHNRAQDVAYVVTIERGNDKRFVALADRDGKLLARPLVLQGTARFSSARSAHAIDAAQSAQAGRALEIIARRCAHARTASISDVLGLASLGRLTKKAIAALPRA